MTTIRRQSKILPVELDALRVRRAGVRSARGRADGVAPEFDVQELGYVVVNRVAGINWLSGGRIRPARQGRAAPRRRRFRANRGVQARYLPPHHRQVAPALSRGRRRGLDEPLPGAPTVEVDGAGPRPGAGRHETPAAGRKPTNVCGHRSVPSSGSPPAFMSASRSSSPMRSSRSQRPRRGAGPRRCPGRTYWPTVRQPLQRMLSQLSMCRTGVALPAAQRADLAAQRGRGRDHAGDRLALDPRRRHRQRQSRRGVVRQFDRAALELGGDDFAPCSWFRPCRWGDRACD